MSIKIKTFRSLALINVNFKIISGGGRGGYGGGYGGKKIIL